MLVDGDKIKSIDRLLNRLQDQLDGAELEDLKAKILRMEKQGTPVKEKIQAMDKRGNISIGNERINVMDLMKRGNPNKHNIIEQIPKFRAHIVGDIKNNLFVEKK